MAFQKILELLRSCCGIRVSSESSQVTPLWGLFRKVLDHPAAWFVRYCRSVRAVSVKRALKGLASLAGGRVAGRCRLGGDLEGRLGRIRSPGLRSRQPDLGQAVPAQQGEQPSGQLLGRLERGAAASGNRLLHFTSRWERLFSMITRVRIGKDVHF